MNDNDNKKVMNDLPSIQRKCTYSKTVYVFEESVRIRRKCTYSKNYQGGNEDMEVWSIIVRIREK